MTMGHLEVGAIRGKDTRAVRASGQRDQHIKMQVAKFPRGKSLLRTVEAPGFMVMGMVMPGPPDVAAPA